MNHDHLSPDEFVDALDGALTAARAAHLDACETCRATLAEVDQACAEARAVEAPTPSPLFWEHFSQRVREATRAERPRAPWWQGRRRASVLAAAGAVAVLAAVAAPWQSTREIGEAIDAVATARPADDDATWRLVVGMTDEIALEFDDAKDAVAPRAGTTDALLDELTAEQREALVRLLEKEMGESE